MRAFAVAVLWALLPGLSAASLEAPPPDVRLLLDVSGSMRAHDPDNLRSDAVTLLVRSLPDEGRGGIWVFANAAVPVVDHGPTDLFWKRLASIHTRELESRGARSNLPAALAAATWDIAEPSEHTRHIVLLSDGRIDVSADATKNAAARAAFLKSTLPKLAASDFRVHAIVLSGDADAALLRQLAQATGGHYLHARTGKDLAGHVQKVLNRTAAPVYLPVQGQAFVVEPGLEELTIVREGDEAGLKLLDPHGRVYTRQSPGLEVRWHDARGFDLLTIGRPTPGRWQFEGALNGGVMALSELQIRATDVPATLFPGELLHVDFMLFSGGQAVVEETFVRALRPQASLEGETNTVPIFAEYIGGGVFRAHLLDVVRAGPYVLRLGLQGRTFGRETAVPFDLANPVRIRVEPDGSKTVVWAELNDAAVDYSNLTVAAQIREGTGPRRLVPAEAYPAGHWGVPIEARSGSVEVGFNFIGNYLNQKDFSLKTAPVKLRLPVAETQYFVFDRNGRAIPEPEPIQASAEPDPAPAEVPAVIDATAAVPASVAVEPEAIPEPLTLPLWFFAVVGVVNLLIVGFGYFVLRRPALPQAVTERLAELADAAENEVQPEPA